MPSTRRFLIPFLASLCLAASVPIASGQSPSTASPKPRSILVYIGTYTGKKSQGIYVSHLDPATGAMTAPELAGEMINPSWVTIHPSGKFLFANGEFGPYPEGGAVRGFAIGTDGKLTTLNTQASGGHGPCQLAIDHTGKAIMVANYGGGEVAALQIAADGKLSPPAWVDPHPSVGADKPHSHCSAFDPTNHYALNCDAGLDRIYVYRFAAATGELTPNDPPFAATAAGSHPRHLAFSPDGKYCYVINEAGLSVTAYTFDAGHGILHEIQTLSTVPKDFAGKGASTAELVMHPTGKFLYGSNRSSESSIVAYSIDPQTGMMTLVGHTPTPGSPRSFGIDPTGHWLIEGNQDADSLVEFEIDQSTGKLSPTGTKFELGAPVCFQFLEVQP